MRAAAIMLALGALLVMPAAARPALVKVAFAGCPSDGQIGPVAPPREAWKRLWLEPRLARRLAWYQSAHDDGVLGPKGWHCLNLEGSNGWVLLVAPQPLRAADFLTGRGGVTGPGIQLMARAGDTSGRFDVAWIVARYFPKRRSFVDQVVAEGVEPAAAFPSGPFQKDHTRFADDRMVEIDTPPDAVGLGTQSWLARDRLAVRSVAILMGQTPDLLLLNVKLAPEWHDLLPVIAANVVNRR